jgi:acyl transferase domain-containing protein
MSASNQPNSSLGRIAIIGMSGRFPRANSLEQFWANLREGRDCATEFTDDDLQVANIPAALRSHPTMVRRRPIIDDATLFDASFFGFSPREAEIIDPQQRLFLECAWQALEQAGYDASRYKGSIGVYGGGAISTYFLHNIYANPSVMHGVGMFPALLGNDKDFFTTRVSYKLGLRGPSVNVLTGCSSSLVAVHFACQSLLNGECDMALAGGATVSFPQRMGYFFNEGSVNSPDGRCRAFDAKANGTVPADGVGVVLLKRLEAALEERDPIFAVIRGSAINNDGALKAGFTAPSVEGQAAVILEALAVADVSADEIGYVEAHGTGTPLGDPIEVSALGQAFKAARRNYCALGSVKPNIGHTDAAAGVIGLIKTVLALQHEVIPPTINFEAPNPHLNLPASPFFINTEAMPWPRGAKPRLAGVSSFGVGGTNAHVVIEESPRVEASAPSEGWRLLPLSARSPNALREMRANLAAFLNAEPDCNLADVAYTLQVGRKEFPYRSVEVCENAREASLALEAPMPSVSVLSQAHVSFTFMFPGQGAQYPSMGRELYETHLTYREEFDRCARILQPHLGLDLRDLVLVEPTSEVENERLYQTEFAQPALFVTEYALARLLMQWGFQPEAMVGHSLGEFVAACLAGVFTLEDALGLIALRGRLLQELPRGAMLAVSANRIQIAPYIEKNVSLAAVNGEDALALAGPPAEMERLAQRLTAAEVLWRRLPTSRAFHSSMMEPAIFPFVEAVKRVSRARPKLQFLSNLTGAWITAEQAVDPLYWGRQLRETVLFGPSVTELLRKDDRVLLEVGPGQVLTSLARMQSGPQARSRIIPSMRRAKDRQSDCATLLSAVGHAWRFGAAVEWTRIAEGPRRRIALPTYSFERRSYSIQATESELAAALAANDFIPTDSGSIERPLDPRPRLNTAYAPADTAIEAHLVSIWQDLLGIAPIGVHDNLFELGGHSLMAAQLISRLHEAFPIKISLRDLMTEGATISELAAVIDRLLIEHVENLSEEEAVGLLREPANTVGDLQIG